MLGNISTLASLYTMAEHTSIYYSENSRQLYRSLRDGDKTKVMKAYDEASTPDARLKLIPTVHDDTILHMAIYMRQHSIAEEIIRRCSGDDVALLTKKNAFGNTVLHEAAATDYTSLVEELLNKAPSLLSIANKKGEMPLYTAAYFGHTKNFELLAEKVEKNHPDDLHSHLCSLFDPKTPDKVRSTVLHAAIHAEYFGK